MKKLDYNHLTTGALTVDASHLIGVVNDLIDLVNSQQEAIERLQEHVDHEARHISEPVDNLADRIKNLSDAIERLGTLESHGFLPNQDSPQPADDKPHPSTIIPLPTDTHRTVTLRIPKGMTIGDIMWRAFTADSTTPYAFGEWLALLSDTDLQKALDEVEHE